jgi:hypothetical protein
MLPNLQIEPEIWLNHFEYHANRPRALAQGLPDVLTPQEHRLIADSIATFQLGEQSEGRALLRAVRRFAQSRDAAPLVCIIELLIREQQRHAALLRAFMESHAIPVKRTQWTACVFRCLRRLAGFELCVCVLVTAELIGNVYYRALEAVTDCRRLQILCRTLVADELAHVAFESDLLLALQAQRPAALRTAIRVAHRAFFAGAVLVVWHTHRPALRRAGYRMGSFLRTCRAQYSFYLEATPSMSLRRPSAGVPVKARFIHLSR